MKKILAEISLGELADKITILEIKMKKIIDKESLHILKKEYQSLKAIDLRLWYSFLIALSDSLLVIFSILISKIVILSANSPREISAKIFFIEYL